MSDFGSGGTAARYRRSAILERVCLQARVRQRDTGLNQALLLTRQGGRTDPERVYQVWSFEVVQLSLGRDEILALDELLHALDHAFCRVLMELAREPDKVTQQRQLAEDVGRLVGFDKQFALYNSPAGLRALLEWEKTHFLPLGRHMGKPRVNVDHGCTLCGDCVMGCPTNALQLIADEQMLEINDAACTGCGMCALSCREEVIQVSAEAVAFSA